MNAHANGKGTKTAVPHFETIHHSKAEWLDEWQTPAATRFPSTYTAPKYESEWEAREAEHYAYQHWSQVKLVSKLSKGVWEKIERKTGQNLAVSWEREQLLAFY
jgi:hypothetical protein